MGKLETCISRTRFLSKMKTLPNDATCIMARRRNKHLIIHWGANLRLLQQ